MHYTWSVPNIVYYLDIVTQPLPNQLLKNAYKNFVNTIPGIIPQKFPFGMLCMSLAGKLKS